MGEGVESLYQRRWPFAHGKHALRSAWTRSIPCLQMTRTTKLRSWMRPLLRSMMVLLLLMIVLVRRTGLERMKVPAH